MTEYFRLTACDGPYMLYMLSVRKKISGWMKQDGLLFVHHFCHKTFSYHFEVLLCYNKACQSTLQSFHQISCWLMASQLLCRMMVLSQTSEEWLKRMDQNSAAIKLIMQSTYGKDSAVKWTVYWRTFLIAVAELFGYNNGEEWMVTLFLFKKK